ncbi:MAG: amidohydrolase family protein [Acutalibacteraceae bacterium]
MSHITRKVIDVHTHVFSDRLAKKASDNIVNFYSLPKECEGTCGELIDRAEKFDNIRFVISSATLSPAHCRIGNDFLLDAAKENSRFIPLVSFHPSMGLSEVSAELERCKKLGAKGVKLHSDFQNFNIDSREVIPMYRICAEMELPILFHVGDSRYDRTTPQRMYNVMNEIPDLTIIAAHMCGYDEWDDAERLLIGSRCYTDVSEAVNYLEKDRLVRMINRHGADKIMFGSDYPLVSTETAYDLFDSLPLSEEQKEQILHLTAEKVFKL